MMSQLPKPFFFTLIAIALTWAQLCVADDSVPLLYSRANIKIVHAAIPEQPPLPWQDKEAIASRNQSIFDVEIRDGADFYNQQGWFNLSSPSQTQGILLTFGAPILAPVAPATHYAPLDILMLDHEGKIIQILPGVVLSELNEEIYPAAPVTAFLIITGGACEQLSIHPGDFVEYKLFKRPPMVLKPA